MSPPERRRLEEFHEQMAPIAEGGDVAAFAAANHAFHTMIYLGTHNSVLVEMTTAMRRRLSPFRQAQFHLEGRPPRSHREHGAVVRAILKGDADAAHAAMLRHVTLVESSFEELCAQNRAGRNAAGVA